MTLKIYRRNFFELAQQEQLDANKAKGAAICKAKLWKVDKAIKIISEEREKSFWIMAKGAK